MLPQLGHKCIQLRAGCGTDPERFQILRQHRAVLERKLVGRFIQEEIERIVDGHFSDHLDLDFHLEHRIGKNHPGIPVRKRILLPMQEVLSPGDLLGIAKNGGPAMRCWPQSDHMRSMTDSRVIGVVSDVSQGNVDGHGNWVVERRVRARPKPAPSETDVHSTIPGWCAVDARLTTDSLSSATLEGASPQRNPRLLPCESWYGSTGAWESQHHRPVTEVRPYEKRRKRRIPGETFRGGRTF